MPEASTTEFRVFSNPVGVMPLVLLLWLVLVLLAWALVALAQRLGFPTEEIASQLRPTDTQDCHRVLFVAYGLLFVSWWLVYLSSPSLSARLLRRCPDSQLATLRTLLSTKAVMWDAQALRHLGAERRNLLLDALHRKCQTGITSTAILATGAFAGLVALVGWRRSPTLTPPSSLWESSLLGLAVIATFAAFIALLVSIDALDTALNQFKDPEQDDNLKPYFYLHAVKRRYAGFTALSAAVILATASTDPLFACVEIGIMLAIGYSYWFADFDNPRRLLWQAVIAATLLIVFPVFLKVIELRHAPA
jgi:hypothetical protein